MAAISCLKLRTSAGFIFPLSFLGSKQQITRQFFKKRNDQNAIYCAINRVLVSALIEKRC